MLTEKEIIENNTLIAIFMGWRLDARKSDLLMIGEEFKPGFSMRLTSSCNYHDSWEALMPVLEKISRIEYERWEDELPDGSKQTVIDTAYPSTFGMLNNEGKPMVRINRYSLFEADSLIEATYAAIVEFINSNP